MALIILEIFVPGFVLACLGVGALAGGAAAALGWSVTVQLVVAAAASLLSFMFLRPVALKMSEAKDGATTGVDALLGRECRVTQPFDASTGLGRCKVDGDDWRAELADRAQAPEAGEHAAVWVVRVESNTLIVTTTSPIVTTTSPTPKSP